MGKRRLDDLLVSRGLLANRGQAERACIAGMVRSPDATLTKPGTLIDEHTPLTLAGHRRFVSRGGEKLSGALDDLGLDVNGARCIDIGASSGGFTDCLLQYGAAHVCAVDVAYAQFDWSLRGDKRVSLFERTNIRAASPEELGAPFDVAVADLSFTTLGGMMGVIAGLLRPGGSLVALVKPQFELRKDLVKGGVVTDPAAHATALQSVLAALDGTVLAPQRLVFSHIKGPKGNIEFFLWAQHGGIPATIETGEVVAAAHAAHDRPAATR